MYTLKKKQLVLYFMFIAIMLASCNNGKPTTYFDADWKTTTKENAAYYRTQPKYAKEQWTINDYYISGEKQFIGSATDSLGTSLDGICTWYYKTGKVQNKAQYIEGKQIGYYEIREDATGSIEEGWDEDAFYYVDETNVVDAADAQESIENSYEQYYVGTFNKAMELHYATKKENKFVLYYTKKGDTIARLDYNNDGEKWSGKEVLFYEEQKQGKNEMIAIKRITTYNEGFVTHTEYYDGEDNIMAQGTFKKNKPFEGTYYDTQCANYKISTYKKGELIKETTYDIEDYNIGEVTFKNGVPFSGPYYGCNNVKNYKDGKLHGESIAYFSFQGAQNHEASFTYKKGEKHGPYDIYEEDQYILEKGNYTNGQLTGDVFYYHNKDILEDGEEEYNEISNNYYIKANVRQRNNRLFIEEIKRYRTDDNALLKTYGFEENDTDNFSYLSNGFHSIVEEDLNFDGFNDLTITLDYYQYDQTSLTYYFYNPKTNKYQHVQALDDTPVEIDISDKTLSAYIGEPFGDESKEITYGFENNTLEIKKITESLYHSHVDSIITTQTFPVPIDTYPLLGSDMPPFTFIQENKLQFIQNNSVAINLEAAPFAISFPGYYKNKDQGFTVKITASFSKDIFKKAIINQREEESPILNSKQSFAYGSENPVFIVDEDGHNLLYYDSTPYGNLEYVKHIGEKVVLLQCTIDTIATEDGEISLSEIKKPMYMVIYIDKNQNLKIDANELHTVTITFT